MLQLTSLTDHVCTECVEAKAMMWKEESETYTALSRELAYMIEKICTLKSLTQITFLLPDPSQEEPKEPCGDGVTNCQTIPSTRLR